MRILFGASLVTAVAGAIVWLLTRTPPFLEAATATSAADRARDRLAHDARWFGHVRWMAVAVAAIIVAGVGTLQWLPAGQVGGLLLVTGALGLSNLGYSRLLRQGRYGPGHLTAQLYLDIGFLTLMLHLAGGIENPLYLLPVFHVLLAATALPRRQSLLLAVVGAAVCTVAVWAEWAGLFPHVTLQVFPHGDHGDVHEAYDARYVAAHTSLRALMMLLTAHFVSRLAEQSRAYEAQLGTAADEARAGRELLAQSLESSGIGLRVRHRTLGVVFGNEQWRSWFGESAPAEALDAAQRTLSDSEVRSTEVRVAAGGERAASCYLVTTAPLHDREGRTDRVAEVVRDIGPEKELQARMLSASKLAAVGEIAGKLAHEINNPTAIINAKARLLLSDRRAEMSDKVAREVGRFVELSDRVASIARGLLAYGRPSGARRRRMDLRTPVRRALSHVQEQASRQGVELVDEVGDDACPVEASDGELEQVFLNLLLNALDSMSAGGVLTASVARALDASGQDIAMAAVSDTGPGVPEDVRERVFEPFFTTKEDSKGSGLGLSVCEGIIRNHGGSIALEQGESPGARFVVRLPAFAEGTGEGADD